MQITLNKYRSLTTISHKIFINIFHVQINKLKSYCELLGDFLILECFTLSDPFLVHWNYKPIFNVLNFCRSSENIQITPNDILLFLEVFLATCSFLFKLIFKLNFCKCCIVLACSKPILEKFVPFSGSVWNKLNLLIFSSILFWNIKPWNSSVFSLDLLCYKIFLFSSLSIVCE